MKKKMDREFFQNSVMKIKSGYLVTIIVPAYNVEKTIENCIKSISSQTYEMIEIIIERILHIGEIPLCNGIPSRALHIGNFCFILCYNNI